MHTPLFWFVTKALLSTELALNIKVRYELPYQNCRPMGQDTIEIRRENCNRVELTTSYYKVQYISWTRAYIMVHWPMWKDASSDAGLYRMINFILGWSEAAPLSKFHSSLANGTMRDSKVMPWGYRWRSSSLFITATICVALFSGRIPVLIPALMLRACAI